MTEEEAQRIADSIEIREWPPLADVLDESQEGQVTCHPIDDGWQFSAIHKPGLPEWRVKGFEEWARKRAYFLALTGDPQIDGWFRRKSDDGWQMTARLVQMPDDPFED